MNIFRFTIKYYDEELKKIIIEKGFIASDNFSSAVKRLEDFYGETLCSIEDLYYTEGDGVLIDCFIKDIFEEEKQQVINKFFN